MKPVVYVETSVVSYLTARQSRDLVVAAYQEVTREWWRAASGRFDLVASELVVTEAGAGDADAASARLEVLKPVALLNVTESSEALARRLLDLDAVPRQAAADAAHIAIAVTNGVDFLVTWNFKHIANAAMRSRIERVCRQADYEPPVICTPNELMEADHADRTA
ncbi:MAG: type II toxin-antitoxin system VapC family toxin [Alphaproteobacteria bacterium]|nr:type II toxin-antitoxin system VapC family toxin [Alphaproteobacteria bacterium]MYE02327.1 type II toxin-antitoxin system VapC family toxin [Alphaproteobacteria bacterium]